MGNFIALIGLVLFFLVILPNSSLSFRPKNADYVARLITSVFTLLILITLVSIIVPVKYSAISMQLALGVIVLITISSIVNIIRSNLQIFFRYTFIPFSTLLIPIMLTLIFSPGGIRYHSSPDNHGFAATVGYFHENFSLRAISDDYKEATGLTTTAFYGQPSPKLESVWHISDVRLRFAADNVFQVGRISMPLLAALLSKIFGITETFSWFLLLLTLIGIWITGSLMFQTMNVLRVVLNLATSSDSSSSNLNQLNREYHSANVAKNFYYWTYATALLVTLSTWSQVFIFEGTLNQAWLYCAVLGFFYASLRIYLAHLAADEKSPEDLRIYYVLLVTSPLSLATFYPNGVILCLYYGLILLSLLSVMVLINKKKKKSRTLNRILDKQLLILMMTSIFAGTIFAFILIKDSFVILTKNFLLGAPNQPYSLGLIPFDRFIPFFDFSTEFDAVTSFGTGFSPIPIDSFRALFPLIVLLLVMLYAAVLALSRLCFLHSIPYFVILVFSLPLLLIPIRALVLSTEVFWPYQYFRNLVNVFILFVPLLIAVLISLRDTRRSQSSRKNSSASSKFLFTGALVILSAIAFADRGSEFAKSSEPFFSIQNIESVDFADQPYFIADQSYHQTYQLTLYGEVLNLTDNWEPQFEPDPQGVSRPIYAVYKTDKSEFTLKNLGTFRLNETTKGPIYLNQLVSP